MRAAGNDGHCTSSSVITSTHCYLWQLQVQVQHVQVQLRCCCQFGLPGSSLRVFYNTAVLQVCCNCASKYCTTCTAAAICFPLVHAASTSSRPLLLLVYLTQPHTRCPPPEFVLNREIATKPGCAERSAIASVQEAPLRRRGALARGMDEVYNMYGTPDCRGRQEKKIHDQHYNTFPPVLGEMRNMFSTFICTSSRQQAH